MSVDWSRVTVEHVRQACALYDAGIETPERPARSTFLLVNGMTYPAKFIRGLAYRIATGVELNPSQDFAGGAETVRFFAKLGLSTTYNPTPPDAAIPPTPLADARAEENAVQRRYEPQKQALLDLLGQRFGTVELEATFPWLIVPGVEALDELLGNIFQTLQAMRGYSAFSKAGQSLRCDFVVPQERLIVEYDEQQHFTLQRATTLERYPADLTLGFDRGEWITTCNRIQAHDPSPPYRDEQRAFYDTLRDILADRNSYRLIRFRQGSFDWTNLDAEKKLAQAVSALGGVAWVRPCDAAASAEIHKIALVSHNYNLPGDRELYDYSEHFAEINRLCDNQGCDTILYALYTWSLNSPVAKTHASMFSELAHVQRIILEVWEPPDRFDHVEVWRRDQTEPFAAYQRFATSSSPDREKRLFLEDLSIRRVADGLLMICGESNIVSLVRGEDAFSDPFAFADTLQDMQVRVILNPIHDYMRRYEMREKRRYYSRGGRTVISVWNQGKGKEAWLPWTVFHDGHEHTEQVQELPTPIPDRPDIRIGTLDLTSLSPS